MLFVELALEGYMLRLLLLALSFCMLGTAHAEAERISDMEKIRTELDGLKGSIVDIRRQSSIAFDQNEALLHESQKTLINMNEIVKNHAAQQEKFVAVINEVRAFKEQKTDLDFSISTDWPYVISVVLSIILSAFVTWLLLRKDAKSNHIRLVKEFRQEWVNDFRNTVAAYIDIVSQIQAFQQSNTDFQVTRSILNEIANELEEKKIEIENKNISRIEKVRQKLNASRELSEETKVEHTKEYQAKYREYLTLLSQSKILSSKLHLLLKPEFGDSDEKDEAVSSALITIEQYLNNPNTRYKTMAHDSLVHYSQILLSATRKLLKSEWDRIKNLDKD